MTEFDRFVSLYDKQALHTLDYYQALKADHWQAVPVRSDALFLGKRVKTITISALARHLMTAESHWINSLRAGQSEILLPQPDPAIEALSDGRELIQGYAQSHQERLRVLAALGNMDLGREVAFTGRRYSVQGLLWAIYSHHAYHLGQIDLLMRQLGTVAPEYMEWPEMEGVIA